MTLSLYHLVVLCLIVGSVLELISKKNNKIFFLTVFITLIAMAMFGLKQGSDFYGYSYIYYHVPKISDFGGFKEAIDGLNNINLHGEIGFKIVISILRELNFDYFLFEACCSLFLMLLLLNFIIHHCKYWCISLLLSLHTVYLTYFLSGVRQGIAMACFLAILLPMLINKKNIIFYIFVTLLLSSIHSAALVYLILPIILNIKTLKKLLYRPEIQLILIFLSYSVGFILAKGTFLPLFSKILPPSIMIYISGNESIPIIPIAERLTLYIITLFLANNYNGENRETIKIFQLISFIGVLLYGCTMFSSLIASRLCLMFKITEIGVISNCLSLLNKKNMLISIFIVLYSLLMYYKNINSYIIQRNMHISFKSYNYDSWISKKYIVNYNKSGKDYILDYYFK